MKKPKNDDALFHARRYGTYNIQPTADTENDFPLIAQGLPRSAVDRQDFAGLGGDRVLQRGGRKHRDGGSVAEQPPH